jgi:hypothetical protein
MPLAPAAAAQQQQQPGAGQAPPAASQALLADVSQLRRRSVCARCAALCAYLAPTLSS